MSTDDIKALVKSEIACGDCRGLTRAALIPAADKPCATQGIQEASKICKHFRTDIHGLRNMMQKNGDILVGMFEMFGKLEDRDLRLIAGMLLGEAKTRRYGFKMGQPVFVRYRGREKRNYLNNFIAARVMDIDDEYIRVMSEDGQIVLTYLNTGFEGPSLYSKPAFKKLRAEMIQQGKLIDPEKEIKTSKRFMPEEGDVKFSTPSSLDGLTIPRMGEVVKGKKAKKKRKTNTLVDFAGMVENGFDMGADVDESGQMELGDNSYRSSTGKRRVRVGKNGAVDLSDL